MERAGFIVCPHAYSWPSHSALSSPCSPSSSLLPGLREVAGRETWPFRARDLCVTDGLVECFRPGRGPPCLQLSRWLSDSCPSLPRAPPHCPSAWGSSRTVGYLWAHPSAPEYSPSPVLSGFNPSLPGWAWLLSSGNQKWQMAAWCMRHLHRWVHMPQTGKNPICHTFMIWKYIPLEAMWCHETLSGWLELKSQDRHLKCVWPWATIGCNFFFESVSWEFKIIIPTS